MSERGSNSTQCFHHFISVTVYRLFVRSADEDYLLFRYCFVNGFIREAYWKAAQSLEKVLKAILLLNGRSSKGYGHSLSWLYDDAVQLSPLFSVDLEKPRELHDDFWFQGDASHFIQRVEFQGSPESRYSLVGWSVNRGDLFAMDQVYKSLRRKCAPLGWVVGEDICNFDQNSSREGQSFSEIFQNEKEYSYYGEIVSSSRDLIEFGSTKSILRYLNLEIGRIDESADMPLSRVVASALGSFENSELHMISERIKSGDRSPHFIKGVEWLIQNVTISKESSRDLARRIKLAP